MRHRTMCAFTNRPLGSSMAAVFVIATLVVAVGCTAESTPAPAMPEIGDVMTEVAADTPAVETATTLELPAATDPGEAAESTHGTAAATSRITGIDANAVLTDTQTYTNATYGYAIDVPVAWYVSDGERPDYTTITSYDIDEAVGRGGVPEDKTKIDLVIRQDITDMSLDARADAIVTDAESVALREQIELQVGPAVRLSYSAMGDIEAVITTVDGEPLDVYAFGGQELFDAIVRTLRLAQ